MINFLSTTLSILFFISGVTATAFAQARTLVIPGGAEAEVPSELVRQINGAWTLAKFGCDLELSESEIDDLRPDGYNGVQNVNIDYPRFSEQVNQGLKCKETVPEPLSDSTLYCGDGISTQGLAGYVGPRENDVHQFYFEALEHTTDGFSTVIGIDANWISVKVKDQAYLRLGYHVPQCLRTLNLYFVPAVLF